MVSQSSSSINGIERTDLVIGLTYAVGTRAEIVTSTMERHLAEFNYHAHVIKISREILDSQPLDPHEDAYKRMMRLMDCGNAMREDSEDYGVLALSAVQLIVKIRKKQRLEFSQDSKTQAQSATDLNSEPEEPAESKQSKQPMAEDAEAGQPEGTELSGHAFIISSLKHPQEVEELRKIYSSSFFLVAINESEDQRYANLVHSKDIRGSDADKLIKRDEGEDEPFGQHTRDVFEMADIHLTLNPSIPMENKKPEIIDALLTQQVDQQVARILDLIFGNPFATPTFDEYAMFMAYASGLRSADLSRQTGAVITTQLQEIVATGANEVPKFGGGQYWPNPETYKDTLGGRDYTKGKDTNRTERARIVEEIVDLFNYRGTDKEKETEKEKVRQSLLRSSIKYLTEYSRPVHAEMSAIIACARSGISLNGATLYCSTFPCHNCAKHIINAGIKRVVFIEPYPKSKTMELYSDSATITRENGKVSFEEFVGIGPRRFFDLFSLKLSSGRSIIRQSDSGIVQWDRTSAHLRCPLVMSHSDRETLELIRFRTLQEKINRPENQSAENLEEDSHV